MFLVEGWEKSKGTLKEIAIAKTYNIPTFEDIDDLLGWADMDGEI